MVELSYLAEQINNNQAMYCPKLVNQGQTATTTDIFKKIFFAINGNTNLARVESEVNQAKGAAMLPT